MRTWAKLLLIFLVIAFVLSAPFLAGAVDVRAQSVTPIYMYLPTMRVSAGSMDVDLLANYRQHVITNPLSNFSSVTYYDSIISVDEADVFFGWSVDEVTIGYGSMLIPDVPDTREVEGSHVIPEWDVTNNSPTGTIPEINVTISYTEVSPDGSAEWHSYETFTPDGTLIGMYAEYSTVSNAIVSHIRNELYSGQYATAISINVNSPDAILTSVNIYYPYVNEYASLFTVDTDFYYDMGYSDGYVNGYDQGEVDTYPLAYDHGYDDGYTDGYNGGYHDGYAKDLNGIDWMLNILDSVFNFPIVRFPNGSSLTCGMIIGVVLGIPLLIWFLKLFAGG